MPTEQPKKQPAGRQQSASQHQPAGQPKQPASRPTRNTTGQPKQQPTRRPTQQPTKRAYKKVNSRREVMGLRKSYIPMIASVFVVAIIAAVAIFAISKFINPEDIEGTQTNTSSKNGQVSFVAVGDNLPEANAGAYADACAGEVGDGVRDYTPIYANIKPYIEAADLAYINQETHLGGNDIGPRGYPSFNTTDEMAEAVVSTGFDLVASATNHSYDWGYFGAVDHSLSIWTQQPVVFTGTAATQEQADTLATIERNGITFALLNYTYGVNGYTQDQLPSYAVNFIDEDRIRADVARAKEAADVVLVAMHWGTENEQTIDENQAKYAQILADLEVDVVLGSHTHTIGPMAWVESSTGTGHKTLVAYSLGNFISYHEAPLLENEIEGMLSCDFIKKNGEVSIENVVWTPLVNHYGEGVMSVYALKDYTPELAAQHRIFANNENAIAEMKELTQQVIGSEFTIDM